VSPETATTPRHLARVATTHIEIPPDAPGRQVILATLGALRADLRALDAEGSTHPARVARRVLLAHRIRSLDASLAETAAVDDDLMALADTLQPTGRRRLTVVPDQLTAAAHDVVTRRLRAIGVTE
jgi:hypothetical protein